MPSQWTDVGLLQDIPNLVNNTLHQLLDVLNVHLQQGSGLVYRAILSLDINISKRTFGKSTAAQDMVQLSESNFGHNMEFDLSSLCKRKFRHRKNTILDIKASHFFKNTIFLKK